MCIRDRGKIKLKRPGSKKDPNTAAEVELPIDMPGMSPTPVSYTHLDVYKRQIINISKHGAGLLIGSIFSCDKTHHAVLSGIGGN